MRIADRFGNDYTLSEILALSDSLLPDSAIAPAGMFTLYFEDVMNANPNNNSFMNPTARATLARVYADISAMLNYTAPAGRVRIYIRESVTATNAAAMAGSSYYVFPEALTNSLLYGEVWKAIVTGNGNTMPFGEETYHGFMQLNLAYLYQFDPDAAFPTGNEYDFYTIALHQAIQILGLNTAIDMNDTLHSYATRYDLQLKDANNTQLVTLNNGLPVFNNAISLTNGCNTLYFEGINTNLQALYTPTTWESGNSLCEVGCNLTGCTVDDFVMKHCIGTGAFYALRHPHIQEASMLADIGYQLTGRYGVVGTSTDWEYEGDFLMGACFANAVEDAYSMLFGQTTITMPVLFNDNLIGAGPFTVSTTFPPIFITPPSGTLAVVNGNTEVSYMPTAGTWGLVIILYTPECNGSVGSANIIRIWIAPPPCQPSLICGDTHIDCGDFECYLNTGDFRDRTTASWSNPFKIGANPSPSPDLYQGGSGAFVNVECNGTGIVLTPFPGNVGSSQFVGLIAQELSNGTEAPEGFALQLCRPIVQGQSGQVGFWARLADPSCLVNQIGVHGDFLLSPPVPTQEIFANPGVIAGGPAAIMGTGANLNANGYEYYTIPFINPLNSGQTWQWLFVYTEVINPVSPNQNIGYRYGYVLLDDMSLNLNEIAYSIDKNVVGGNTYTLGSTVTYQVTVCATTANPNITTANATVGDILSTDFEIGTFQWLNPLTMTHNLVGNTLTAYPVITLANGTGCATYSYSIEIKNCACDNVSPTIENCANIIAADFRCGTALDDEDCVTINVSNAATTYSNVTSTSVGANFPPGTVLINGTFTVDNNFSVSLTDITLCEGAEIIVTNGATLNIQTSHLHGCDYLWRSVQCQNGGTLIIGKSFIEDAEFGVYALDGSNITLESNHFDHNFIGIHVPSTNGAYQQNIVHVINGNTIECTGNILPAYAGQSSILPVLPPNTAIGYAGVYAFDTRLILTLNHIQHLPVGILVRRADLVSDRNDFLDIHQNAAYPFGAVFNLAHGYGAGIWALGNGTTSSTSVYSLTVFGFGNGQNVTPNFTNCDKGVWSQRYNVAILQNNMSQVQQGIHVRLSPNRTINIEKNYIHAFLRGIELISNDVSAGIMVQNNVIDVGLNLLPLSTIPGIGIYINETHNPNPLVVQGCTVNVFNAREGIRMLNQTAGNILRNNIHIFAPPLSLVNLGRNGILAASDDRVRINCNTVVGSTLSGGVSQNCFGMQMITYSELACNNSDNSPQGFAFNLNCPGTNFQSNTIGTHFRGLTLNATAIIDAQTLKGNLWQTVNPYGSGFGAFHVGGFNQAQLSTFFVNPVGPPINYTFFPSFNVPNWFNIVNGSNETCIDGVCLPQTAAAMNINDSDSDLAQGTYQTAEFEEENKWFASRSVYGKYAENDSLLLAAGDTIQVWFDSLSVTNIAGFHELHTQTTEVVAIDESTKVLLKAAADSTMMYADSLAVIDSLLQGANSMDSTLLESNRAGILNSISQIAQSQRENGSQIDSTNLVAIVNNNANLQASEQYDINEKAVNAIYLSTIAIGNADFSEPQIQILIDIAYQCPITGGPAVFLARGLYDFVNAEAMYDDEDICAVQGQQWRQNQVKSKTEYIKIFPNPTDELVNIIVPISKQTYQISIFDALGNSIFTSTIAENTSEHTFSTSSLANGVYYCVVKQSAEVIHAEKLIIIHH